MCTDGLVVKNYPSHREYSKSFAIRNKLASLGKDDPYSLGNNPNFEEKFLTDQFDVICSNDGGYFIDGWCVDKSNKDRALFWAKIKPTGKDFNGVVRPAIAFVVIAPPLNKTANDPVWINYIGSLGFLTASERKLQTEQMLKKKASEQWFAEKLQQVYIPHRDTWTRDTSKTQQTVASK